MAAKATSVACLSKAGRVKANRALRFFRGLGTNNCRKLTLSTIKRDIDCACIRQMGQVPASFTVRTKPKSVAAGLWTRQRLAGYEKSYVRIKATLKARTCRYPPVAQGQMESHALLAAVGLQGDRGDQHMSCYFLSYFVFVLVEPTSRLHPLCLTTQALNARFLSHCGPCSLGGAVSRKTKVNCSLRSGKYSRNCKYN